MNDFIIFLISSSLGISHYANVSLIINYYFHLLNVKTQVQANTSKRAEVTMVINYFISPKPVQRFSVLQLQL